jgi:hypothetical protein
MLWCVQKLRRGSSSCSSYRDAYLHVLANGRHALPACRGDLVSIETWFQKDSRISFERNWDIRDVKSGRRLGMATRFGPVSGLRV